MPTINTPGVYIDKIARSSSIVDQDATAIPAFIGYTEKYIASPIRIESLQQFEDVFGGAYASIQIPISITGATAAAPIYYVNFYGPQYTTVSFYLYYSIQMYFLNGGGPCYISSAGAYPSNGEVSKTDLTSALGKIATEEEITLIVIPDAAKLGTQTEYGDLMKEVLLQCDKLQNRFAIIDVIGSFDDFKECIGTERLKYGAAYYPFLKTDLTYPDSAIVLYGTAPFSQPNNPQGITLKEAIIQAGTNQDIAKALKQIESTVRDDVRTLNIAIPPSGAIAGIYAAVDASRGVWKAPANVSVKSIIGPAVKVTDGEQDKLNIDATSGKSINVIRSFTGKGTLVWGGRTLAGNDNEWRYVNVRRLFIAVEKAVKKNTGYVVFEPNDANTWIEIRSTIENYLISMWKKGALVGATPDEAFFVNVGIGSTMSADDILNGKLNIEIGLAAVRPAEFIILKFSYKLQTT